MKTDAGGAFAKALGNPEGPVVLACEWLGLALARALGLPTVEPAIVDLDPEVCWQLDPEDPDSDRVVAGPALVTREHAATVWDGSSAMLKAVANPEVLTGLIVLDTWLRNPDRHSPEGDRQNVRNVLLSEESAPKGKFRVVAMDFSHAVSGGRSLAKSHLGIDATRDERIYGCFPAFGPYVQLRVVNEFVTRMRGVRKDSVQSVVDRIPRSWGVSAELRPLVVRFVVDRANYLSTTLAARVSEKWTLAEGP